MVDFECLSEAEWGLERPIRASRRGRVGSKSETSTGAVVLSALAKPKRSRAANWDRLSEAKRAQAVNFQRPSEFERAPAAASRRRQAGSSGRFERPSATPSGVGRADFQLPSDAERGWSGKFRALWRGRAGSMPRSRIRWQVRCFRARPSRVELRTASGASKASCGNLILDIYICIYIYI